MRVKLQAGAAGRRSRRSRAVAAVALLLGLLVVGVAGAKAGALAAREPSQRRHHRSQQPRRRHRRAHRHRAGRSAHRHRARRSAHRRRARPAAHPKAGAHYSGSGADYLNNTPRWLHEDDGHISFATSANGSRILDFKGTLSFACETESHYVAARYILVKRDGSFAYRFNFPTKSASGQPLGREYVAIYGRFLAHGERASVSYFVDSVVPEKHVSKPYDTTSPTSLGCASWVRGTARAG